MMSEIVNIISSIGFPIVACIALFLLITKELRQVKEAIDNNTRVVTALLAHFNESEGD